MPSEGFSSFYLLTVSPLWYCVKTLVIHQQPFNLGALFSHGALNFAKLDQKDPLIWSAIVSVPLLRLASTDYLR